MEQVKRKPRAWRIDTMAAAEPLSLPPWIRQRIEALEDAVAKLRTAVGEHADRVAEMVQLPAQAAPARSANDDLPAFLRRAGAGSPGFSDTGSGAAGTIDDVIEMLNDVERQIADRLRNHDDRIEIMERRLDIPTQPAPGVDGAEAIRALEEWLRAIDERASRAVAATADIEQRIAAATPASIDAETDAQGPADMVKAAARARRNALIGGTADDRDVRVRLTEVGLNAGSGHERSIDMLARLASGYGMPIDDLRRALIEAHDTATRHVVETTLIELRAVAAMAAVDPVKAEAIATTAVADLEKVGA